MQPLDHQMKDEGSVFLGFGMGGEILRRPPLLGPHGADRRIEAATFVVALQPQPPNQVVGGLAARAAELRSGPRIVADVKTAMQAGCHGNSP